MPHSNTATTSSSTLSLAAAGTVAALAAWGCYAYVTYDCRWWWKRRAAQKEYEVANQPNWEATLVHGYCAPGWEAVREEFLQNFRLRGELGAAVCIYFRGVKVVDLWGGFRNRNIKLPWQKDTLVPIFSTTKGVSAFALQMLASRGKLDLDEKVVRYWPEFGQNGKDNITVRQLIDHSVGLAGIDPPVTLKMLQGPKQELLDHLARAEMEWPNAGDYKGYMAVTLGFYESAIVQKTDDSGKQRTIGQYLRDEAFVPLGIEDELYMGLDPNKFSNRLAKLDAMKALETIWSTGTLPDSFMREILFQPNSYRGRAFRNPQLSSMPMMLDWEKPEVQRVEIPAAGGHGTARAVATLYKAAERAINAKGDNPLGLTPKFLQQFTQPPKPGKKNGWIDEVLGLEACMGAGFMLAPPPNEASTKGRFVSVPGGFGTVGAGGSLGFCDPNAEISFCYTPNRCGMFVCDDPREFALRNKMYQCVQRIREQEGGKDLDLERLNAPHFLTQRYLDQYPELAPLP